ncbi:MAG: M1 family aminopeptidase, partial [Gemmatimonadales bacterium]
ILANNEWREGWLDEGFTSFQTTWFWETLGRTGGYEQNEAGILELDLDAYSEPTSLVSEAYRDFVSYNTSIYSRGELFLHQLRHAVGDATMQRILRTYYDRWKLRHVDEAVFRAVAEEVSKRDLSTLFGQGLHAVELYDYAIGKVRVSGAAGQRGSGTNGWITRVEVLRKAEGRLPVEVMVIAQRDTGVVRSEGLAEREWVDVPTASKPKQVVLDPRVRAHDWNMLNNRRRVGGFLSTVFASNSGVHNYFHPYFSTRSRRDRLTIGWQPTAWYNDAGGVTLGVRRRDDYMGRFEQNVALASIGTGLGSDLDVKDADFFFRLRNPVLLRAPNASQTLDVFNVEGRYGITAAVDWSRREHLAFGPTWSRSLRFQWVATDDSRYLDRGLYDDVGTVELQTLGGVATETGKWRLSLNSSIGGGLAYNRQGLAASGRPELDPFYFRGSLDATARRALGPKRNLAARVFAGVASGDHAAAKQRQIYLQGGDPLQQLNNPFLRSRGSLLVGEDFHYHSPGGAGLRGVDQHLSAAGVVAFNLEVDQTLLARPTARLFSRIALAAFGDLARTFDGSDPTLSNELLGDAGIGFRADHRIGDTRFTTRFDLPLFVSRPELAQDRSPGDDEVAFRWTFSFEPAF